MDIRARSYWKYLLATNNIVDTIIQYGVKEKIRHVPDSHDSQLLLLNNDMDTKHKMAPQLILLKTWYSADGTVSRDSGTFKR